MKSSCETCRFWKRIEEEENEIEEVGYAWDGGECTAQVWVDCNGHEYKKFTRPGFTCVGWGEKK